MALTSTSGIISVDGKTNLPAPSSMTWSLEDISASDAGRSEPDPNEGVIMNKKRVGQAVKLNLSWSYLTTSDASKVLKAFNPEYITLTYLDPMIGGANTINFYVGTRTAPMYNGELGLWTNVSFDCIDRNAFIKTWTGTGV